MKESRPSTCSNLGIRCGGQRHAENVAQAPEVERVPWRWRVRRVRTVIASGHLDNLLFEGRYPHLMVIIENDVEQLLNPVSIPIDLEQERLAIGHRMSSYRLCANTTCATNIPGSFVTIRNTVCGGGASCVRTRVVSAAASCSSADHTRPAPRDSSSCSMSCGEPRSSHAASTADVSTSR